MYKKFMLCLLMTGMFIIFGSSVYAQEWTCDSGTVKTSGVGVYKEVLNVSFSNSSVFPILVCVGDLDSLDDIADNDSKLFNLRYVTVNNGTISYSSSISDSSFFLQRDVYRFLGLSSQSVENDSKAYIYLTSGCTGNIPIFTSVGNATTLTSAGQAILEDYFLYGNEKAALYSPGPYGQSVPGYDSENIVEDDNLGYLAALHMSEKLAYLDSSDNMGLVGNTNTLDWDNSGYKYTWQYNHSDYVSGEAVEGPPTLDGKTADGYINKVQIKMTLGYTETHFFTDDEYIEVGTFDMYDNFSDYPAATLLNAFVSLNDMQNVANKNGFSETKYSCNTAYLRLVQYNPNDKKYHVSTWYQVKRLDNGAGGTDTSYVTGKLDENGNFTPDGKGPSYEGTSNLGTITGDELPDDWKNDKDKLEEFENGDIGNWSWDNINSVLDFFMDLPQLLALFFSFVPSVVWWAFAGVLLVVVAMRILGR